MGLAGFNLRRRLAAVAQKQAAASDEGGSAPHGAAALPTQPGSPTGARDVALAGRVRRKPAAADTPKPTDKV